MGFLIIDFRSLSLLEDIFIGKRYEDVHKESKHYAMFKKFCKEGKWLLSGKKS
jgi:hypothetical protein